MKRLALAVVAVAAFAGSASAAPNCDKDYKDFWARISAGSAAKELTGPQIAKLNRLALRGYDSCTSGDERFSADGFFKKLESVSAVKADEFFRDLERSFSAKKK